MRYSRDACGNVFVDHGLGGRPLGIAMNQAAINAGTITAEAEEKPLDPDRPPGCPPGTVWNGRKCVPESNADAVSATNQNWGSNACRDQGATYDAGACPNGCVKQKITGRHSTVDQCCIAQVDAYGRNAGESCADIPDSEAAWIGGGFPGPWAD